jgi:rhodanese-related sulfurtransferase
MLRIPLLLFIFLTNSLIAQQKVSQERFKELMNDSTHVLLDVRTPEEFAEGFIAGNATTVNVNYFSNDFIAKVESKASKDQVLLVYCAAGGRSSTACKELKKAGFKRIFELEGGYNAWVAP